MACMPYNKLGNKIAKYKFSKSLSFAALLVDTRGVILMTSRVTLPICLLALTWPSIALSRAPAPDHTLATCLQSITCMCSKRPFLPIPFTILQHCHVDVQETVQPHTLMTYTWRSTHQWRSGHARVHNPCLRGKTKHAVLCYLFRWNQRICS